MDHFPLELVDLLQCTRGRGNDQLVLQHLNAVAEIFEDDKIAVDDGIEKGIGEIVGPQSADAPLARAQSFAHLGENIPFLLLEGENVAGSENETDLLDAYTVGRIELQHFRDEEKIVAVILQLRPLACVEDILLHQRMDAETAADRLDDRDIVDTVDIQPLNRGLAAQVQAFLNPLEIMFVEAFGTVVEQADTALFRPAFPDMDQRSGRNADLGRRTVGAVQFAAHG